MMLEASVLEADHEIVAPKIKVGCIYEITQLHSHSNKQTFKVVPHTAQLYQHSTFMIVNYLCMFIVTARPGLSFSKM